MLADLLLVVGAVAPTGTVGGIATSHHSSSPTGLVGSGEGSVETAEVTAGCDHVCRGRRLAAQVTVTPPAGWSLEFAPGSSRHLGMADGTRRVITLHVHESAGDEALRWVLYHEIGHAHDFEHLDGHDQRRWAAARGYDADPWYPCDGCRDYGFPAGDWAESFAHCNSGIRGQFRSELADPPDTRQCQVLRTLAG